MLETCVSVTLPDFDCIAELFYKNVTESL